MLMKNALWIVFWSLLGGLIGLAFSQFQKTFINTINLKDSKRILNTSSLLSIFRLLIIFLLLFISFRQSIETGFGFLFFFLISRWIWIIQLMKESRK